MINISLGVVTPNGVNVFPGCGGTVNAVPQCGCTANVGSCS